MVLSNGHLGVQDEQFAHGMGIYGLASLLPLWSGEILAPRYGTLGVFDGLFFFSRDPDARQDRIDGVVVAFPRRRETFESPLLVELGWWTLSARWRGRDRRGSHDRVSSTQPPDPVDLFGVRGPVGELSGPIAALAAGREVLGVVAAAQSSSHRSRSPSGEDSLAALFAIAPPRVSSPACSTLPGLVRRIVGTASTRRLALRRPLTVTPTSVFTLAGAASCRAMLRRAVATGWRLQCRRGCRRGISHVSERLTLRHTPPSSSAFWVFSARWNRVLSRTLVGCSASRSARSRSWLAGAPLDRGGRAHRRMREWAHQTQTSPDIR